MRSGRVAGLNAQPGMARVNFDNRSVAQANGQRRGTAHQHVLQFPDITRELDHLLIGFDRRFALNRFSRHLKSSASLWMCTSSRGVSIRCRHLIVECCHAVCSRPGLQNTVFAVAMGGHFRAAIDF